MNQLKPPEKLFWEEYLSKFKPKELPASPHIEASIAGNVEITDELIDLYSAKKKWGVKDLNEATVITEFFNLLFSK
jgi:hypothetical protein